MFCSHNTTIIVFIVCFHHHVQVGTRILLNELLRKVSQEVRQ